MNYNLAITPDDVRQLLEYDTETGSLKWRVRPLRVDGRPNNRIRPGAEAGWLDKSNGYRRVGVFGTHIHAHRLVYFMQTGEWPETIDHVNGVTADNRFCNLRAATFGENVCNQKLRVNNTSGHTGVSWSHKARAWYAYIAHEKHTYPLGMFVSLEDAVAARRSAELKFHGAFAQHTSRDAA